MSFALAYSIIIPVVTLACLLYAGIQDFLYREVRHEFIWIIMALVGLIMDVCYVIFSDDFQQALLDILITVVIGFLLGFFLFTIGMWGGADSKALWALAVLSPVFPLSEPIFPVTFIDLPIVSSSIFSVLVNAGLISLLYPLFFVGYNTIMAVKKPLFEEVSECTFWDKLRCFLFGYTKEVDSIKASKLHFDFLESFPNQEFKGSFNGTFTGRLDGVFVGLFKGELDGHFSGSVVGSYSKTPSSTIMDQSVEEILTECEPFHDRYLKLKEKSAPLEDYPSPTLQNYRVLLALEELPLASKQDFQSFIDFSGHHNGNLKGFYKGCLAGVFEGSFKGELIGRLIGDFDGSSSEGSLDGHIKQSNRSWQFVFRVGLDEELTMEQRQLRTLWQLKKTKKNKVWVTPGLPFVLLMFIGYVLYLLLGNVFLFLFSI
jgi:ABC-type cobalt transport system substrate-binding protein